MDVALLKFDFSYIFYYYFLYQISGLIAFLLNVGNCVCYEGFTGKTCGLSSNKVPEIQDLPQEGYCDLQLRPCAETPIQGNYFIRGPDLKCKIEPMLVKNSIVSRSFLIIQTNSNVLDKIIITTIII